jgi:hypothetical protein
MYSNDMDYNDETMAEVIIKLDPSARWVYNKYCRYCGKFLYPDNIECKKCRRPTTDPVLRVIPFLTSATAIEKLILWVRTNHSEALIGKITDIYHLWLGSSRSPDTYKLEIVIACINALKE